MAAETGECQRVVDAMPTQTLLVHRSGPSPSISIPLARGRYRIVCQLSCTPSGGIHAGSGMIKKLESDCT